MCSEDLLIVGEGAVVTLGFGLGVYLESTSWISVTQGPEQGYLEIYVNLSSHSFLRDGGECPGLARGHSLASPTHRHFNQKCSLWLEGVSVTFLSRVPPQVFLKLGHLWEAALS